jgi:hypothetical protein
MIIKVPDRPVYWAVMWGKPVEVRVAAAKTKDPRAACLASWGYVEADMRVKNLGSNIKLIRNAAAREQLLDTKSSGWVRLGRL